MIPILAVDPSLTATGWATTTNLPSGGHQHHHGLIQPRTLHNGRWTKLTDPARMLHIAGRTLHLAHQHHALLVAIEGPSFNSRSSSSDTIAGMHWHIRSTLWGAHIPYIVVAPSTIKQYGTGYGHAPKRSENDRHGRHRDGMVDTAREHLNYPGWDDNIADALWLHALTADALGHGYAPPLDDPKATAKRAQAIATVIPHLPKQGVLT